MPDEQGQEQYRLPLTRERIVRAALRIVDTEGLEALTMRRLGADLGVTTMAVYHHFPNKSALYDGIVEAVMAEIDVSADPKDAPFGDRVKYAARAYRDVLVAHPNALPVVLSRGPRTPVALVPVETLVGIFRDAGFSPAESLANMDITASAVQGAALMVAGDAMDRASSQAEVTPQQVAAQLPPDRFPRLVEALSSGHLYDFAAEFELGLETLVRGFESRLAEKRP